MNLIDNSFCTLKINVEEIFSFIVYSLNNSFELEFQLISSPFDVYLRFINIFSIKELNVSEISHKDSIRALCLRVINFLNN